MPDSFPPQCSVRTLYLREYIVHTIVKGYPPYYRLFDSMALPPIIASYIYNDAYVLRQLSDIPLNGLFIHAQYIRPNKQQLCHILHSLTQVLVDMCPQLLTERDGNHRLSLHLASIAASPVPLSLLLTHRPPKSGPPEVNCVDSLLRTPLHYSAAGNHLQNTQVTHICGYHQDTSAMANEFRNLAEHHSG